LNKIVLDSSAILAVLYSEPGASKVVSILHSEEVEVLVSAVNLCEVHTRLLRDGLPDHEASRILANLKLTVVPFEEGDAYAAGELSNQTRSLGLSLGDRACLALATKWSLTARTADRVWKKLRVGIPIELIRI
jgi:PIN domain nuclease of toxin-antitoxin system